MRVLCRQAGQVIESRQERWAKSLARAKAGFGLLVQPVFLVIPQCSVSCLPPATQISVDRDVRPARHRIATCSYKGLSFHRLCSERHQCEAMR